MPRAATRPLTLLGRRIQALQDESALKDEAFCAALKISRSTLDALRYAPVRKPLRSTQANIAKACTDLLKRRVTIEQIFGHDGETGLPSGDTESHFQVNCRENAHARHIALQRLIWRSGSQRAHGDSIQRASVPLRGILHQRCADYRSEDNIA